VTKSPKVSDPSELEAPPDPPGSGASTSRQQFTAPQLPGQISVIALTNVTNLLV
jgi:hypothetical protein